MAAFNVAKACNKNLAFPTIFNGSRQLRATWPQHGYDNLHLTLEGQIGEFDHLHGRWFVDVLTEVSGCPRDWDWAACQDGSIVLHPRMQYDRGGLRRLVLALRRDEEVWLETNQGRVPGEFWRTSSECKPDGTLRGLPSGAVYLRPRFVVRQARPGPKPGRNTDFVRAAWGLAEPILNDPARRPTRVGGKTDLAKLARLIEPMLKKAGYDHKTGSIVKELRDDVRKWETAKKAG